MLTHLSIKNILLIDNLDLDFSSGLVALTGETGAGKSIILDSLLFLIGGKATSNILRNKEIAGMVAGVFGVKAESEINALLKEQEIEAGEDITIRRSINPEGKTKAFINDTPVALALLKEIGQSLIEVHGQNEQSTLLEPSAHRNLLDLYAGLKDELKTLRAIFNEWQGFKKEYAQLLNAQLNSEREKDYLTHIIKELDAIAPQKGEEEVLAGKRSRLVNAGKTIQSLKSAYSELSSQNSPATILNSVFKTVTKIPLESSENHKFLCESLDKAIFELNESERHLENLLGEFELDEDIDAIEERLFALRGLAKKFKITPDDLPSFIEMSKNKLKDLDNADQNLSSLEKKIAAASKQFIDLAKKISQTRQKQAKSLEESIISELKYLKMDKTSFKVLFEELGPESYSGYGIDKITFIASTNPGMPLAPINKIASGGELSRFMLAMKVSLADSNSDATLIFDEIDIGIGGAVADSVGRRLKLLGENSQTFVVTHQPQVASKASSHYLVKKTQSASTTTTNVKLLSKEEQNEEIARMLAGETITDHARQAATALLQDA